MYTITQRSAVLSIVSNSITLSDDSVTEIDQSSRTIRTIDDDDIEELEDEEGSPEVKSTPSPVIPDSPRSSYNMFEEEDWFEEDSELMPLALENKFYQTVNHLLPGELEEIGKTYNFICIDKTHRDKIYQFKARTIRQTVTCYMQSGTVRLQPGGNIFH